MDERSSHGPWTAAALDLIARSPRTAASRLARVLRRETRSLKADVVKLKKLGLTQSLEVGYELTPRGRAFLKRFRIPDTGRTQSRRTTGRGISRAPKCRKKRENLS